eukprot:131208_1
MDSKSENDDKLCRYCLDSKNATNLISPCDCEGTSKYVHQHCLAQWIKTKHASSLRINILQHQSITQTLKCTECRGDYRIKISPISWNTFFYRLLFDNSNQKLLQKMGLQIAWILFQSTALRVVSKALIRHINKFNQTRNNTHNISNNYGSNKMFGQFFKRIMNSCLSSLNKTKNTMKLVFYYLIHPIVSIQTVVTYVFNCIKNILSYIVNPIKIVKCIFHYTITLILLMRIVVLFLLIVQHTASITFNANELYKSFKKHKINLVQMQIL